MPINFPNTSISTTSVDSQNRLTFNGYFRSDNATVPAFLVQNDINADLTTGNSRPVTWNQVVYNDGGWDASGQQLYTAPRAGMYFFYVWMMDDNQVNENDYYTIRRNNSNSAWTGVLRVYSTGNSNHHHQWPGGTIFNMSQGDNVRVYIDRTDRGFYGNDHHYTMFSGCYLGRS